MWRLLAGFQRPALAELASAVVSAQLTDLTAGEWLGLLDRLAVIDGMVPLDQSAGIAALQTMLGLRHRG